MNSIAGHLQTLLASLDEMLKLLDTEAGLLTQGKADDLAELTRRKSPHLQQIARTWNDLGLVLGLSGNASSEALGADLLARQDANLSALWRRTEDLARQVSQRNALNGRLIQEQMRHAHAAIQVLQEAASKGGLYGADGKSLGMFSQQRKLDAV